MLLGTCAGGDYETQLNSWGVPGHQAVRSSDSLTNTCEGNMACNDLQVFDDLTMTIVSNRETTAVGPHL